MSVWHNPSDVHQVVRFFENVDLVNVQREIPCAPGADVDVPDVVGPVMHMLAPLMKPGPMPKREPEQRVEQKRK